MEDDNYYRIREILFEDLREFFTECQHINIDPEQELEEMIAEILSDS